MDETKFEVGQKVTILDVKKVGEVIEVMENGQYQVRYTDDASVFQTEICAPEKLAAVETGDESEKSEGEKEEKTSTEAEGGAETGTETGEKSEEEEKEEGTE